MKLISIIVPVFNLEKYISRTLDSIFSQTYENIEVIAVDDGSEDNSAAILDSYAEKEPRLKVIHKENGGVTEARLAGIKASAGDYIGFVDGDDTIEADMFERLINNIIKYDAEISHCGYKKIKNDKTTFFYNTGKLIVQGNEDGVYDLLSGLFIEPGLWNKLFSRNLFDSSFDSIVQIDRSLKNNEDLVMNYYLFKQSKKSVYEDFCPYCYIVRDDSASKGKMNAHKLGDPARAAKIILDDSLKTKKYISTSAELYAVKLINALSYSENIREAELQQTEKWLHSSLIEFIRSDSYNKIPSRKVKIQAFAVAYFPNIYRFIHKLFKLISKC